MSENADQQVEIAENERKFEWKSFSASLIGDDRARALSRQIDVARSGLSSIATADGRNNRSFIQQFRDRHHGETCVIIGNGPSLRKTNMNLLRTEFTFGLNRLYLMFDELGFSTSYHVVVNRHVIEQCADDFRKLATPLFTTRKARKELSGRADTAFLSNLTGPWFSKDISRGVWEGSTVTFVAMQIAYYMGFQKVILIGVDHRFAVSGKPNQLVESKGPDNSHFDPRYFAKGFKWQLPDLERSELAYRLAKEAFEGDGRSIVDATVEGALRVFPRTSLEQALR